MISKQPIILTTEELALAANPDIMYMKNRIIQAVYELFGQLAEDYQAKSKSLSKELTATPPKISKGENYLGLPWVMLDYPRNFSTENIFAVRTMFWWGHYFSIHLLLKGKVIQLLNREKLPADFSKSEWVFSTSNNPWEHHFENVPKVKMIDLHPDDITSQIDKNGFVKMSCKLPVGAWHQSKAFLQQAFTDIVQLIKETAE